MKKTETAVFVLLEIFLVIVIILLPLRTMIYNEGYYNSQFEKNNVYDEIENADAILDNLLNFFKGEESLIYFEEDEQSHLQDVKVLLHKFFSVFYISIFVIVLLLIALFFVSKKNFKQDFLKLLFLGGLSSFALLALFFLASLNFSLTFEGFHVLFFPQGNYSFASDSLLIMMFPPIFFKSFFTRLLLSSIFVSFVAMVPQYVYNKMKR